MHFRNTVFQLTKRRKMLDFFGKGLNCDLLIQTCTVLQYCRRDFLNNYHYDYESVAFTGTSYQSILMHLPRLRMNAIYLLYLLLPRINYGSPSNIIFFSSVIIVFSDIVLIHCKLNLCVERVTCKFQDIL